jgi:DNA-binding transcriptional ArsR family regulator
MASKQKSLDRVVGLFSSLADKTRLSIVLALAEKPRTVNDIHLQIGREKMTLSAVSHQLRQLSDAGVLSFEKKGKEKIFQLSDNICWCLLRDAFKQSGGKINIKCKKCSK